MVIAVRMRENARNECRILGAFLYSEDRLLLYGVGPWIIESLIHTSPQIVLRHATVVALHIVEFYFLVSGFKSTEDSDS